MLTQPLRQTAEYQSLLAAVAGHVPAALFGLPPTARAQVLAALCEDTGRPALVICAGEADAVRFAADASAFGQKADCLFDITSKIKNVARKPIIMKLSPNVTDITEMAKAAEAAGADAISLINTITGMKIDIHKRTFALANRTGGMSGPAIKPVAVRMVYQASHAVKIPVIGMGGIATAEDAIEFLLAGATAVSVGAVNFMNPYATVEIIEGIEQYMTKYGVEDIQELIGAVN